jgi:anti-sigma factor RsiW
VTEHLSEQLLEQYRRRVMSPTDTLAADDHLALCESCRDLAREPLQIEAVVSGLLENLGSGVVGLETDHPSYEQIVALVDGEFDQASRETVESHLEICAACAEDVNDLRNVRSDLLASSAKESADAMAPTLWQKIAAFTQAIRLPSQPAFTAALATLLLTASVAIFFAWKAKTPAESPRAGGAGASQPSTEVPPGSNIESGVQPSAPQPDVPNNSAIVLALNDAGGRVTFDAAGNVVGLGPISPSSMQAVKEALTTGRVDVPSSSELIGKKSTLLGPKDEADSFSLISPVGTATRSGRPMLRWRQLSGASSYTVSILDADFNAVATSPPLTGTSWTPPRALDRGRTYSWQVTAVKDGKEIVSPSTPAPEARFKVLEKAKADELNEVERVANSHLARGVLYARAGLLDDAERELRALVAENPKSPIAQKLLQSVRASRRK